ncbi:MAG TPA: hypothetical protein VFN89_05320 [Solirubrobacterales bacterium]|nr:hypothetical protein [Solirubrobacterales bacterium]
MSQDEPSGPDLVGVIADANSAGLEHVVIGGFSVIFHGYIRATRDSDLLVPDGEEADETILRFLELADAQRFSDGKKLTIDDIAGVEHLRINSRHGIIDIIRGGSPPLDFDTVSDRADMTEWEGQMVRVAALPSLVGFKRLARRPQDRVDLEELEAIHGDLPVEPIPGLDS